METQKWSYCKKCGREFQLRLDKTSGRFNFSMQSGCDQQAACEDQALVAFGIQERSPQPS
jgi:hypothetical protein